MSRDWRPLSATQSGIWFGQQLDPENPAFSVAGYLEIRGDMRDNLFTDAVHRALTATEAARLEFCERDGKPFQRIAEETRYSFTEIAFDSDPDADSRAHAWMRARLDEPVRMHDELVSAALITVSPTLHLFFLRMHHVALDGYAFQLVTARVVETYAAALEHRDLPHDTIGSLEKYWAEEDTYRAGQAYAADRDYWRTRFAGAPPAVTLARIPGPARPAHHVLRRRVEPGPDDMARLRAAITPAAWAATTLAVTAVYLHRMTGTTDPVLGVPVIGRWGRTAKVTPGMMMTTLPVHLHVTPDTVFADLVDQAGQQLRQVLRHQRFALEEVREVFPAGHRVFGPSVNVMPFTYRATVAGLTVEGRALQSGPIDDLSLELRGDLTDVLRIDVTANPDRYTAADVDAHQQRLIRLLLQLAQAPQTRAGHATLLSPDERRQVLEDWNDTHRPVPDDVLPTLLAAQAAATPHAVALITEDGEITYADLDADANRLARHLISCGAGPGQLVAVALPRSAAQVTALLAVLKSGAAYLPLDDTSPPARVSYMLADAGPALLITDRLRYTDLPATPTALILDDPATATAVARQPAAPVTDTHRTRPLRPGDPVYVLYTSGSTGRPKGVVLPHRALINHLAWMSGVFGLDRHDRVLLKTAATFDVSVWEYFWPLLHGATIVVARPGGHRDPAYLAALITRHQVSTVGFVPSMLREFLDEPATKACTTIRRTLCIGETLPADLAARYSRTLGPGLHNLYGPTEAAVAVTGFDCDTGYDPADGVPIGGPGWNTRCYLLDTGGQPVPPGTPGDLYLAGTQIATGYLNRPDLTAAAFPADPFGAPGDRMYRTGDRARRLPDGTLLFLGRTDDQVKIRGNRIELGEIEATLTGHPTIGQAVVVARPDGDGQPHLIAYLVPTPGTTIPAPAALRAYLQTRLAEATIPTTIMTLDTLPLNSSGKVDRAALPDADPATAPAGRVPRNQLEVVLCGLVEEVLTVPRAGIDDDFFDLGGHSLHAARLASRIRTVLGTDLDLRTIFEHPTVARLATRLQSTPTGPDGALDTLLPLRTGGTGIPLFCLPPVTGLSWCYSVLLRHIDPDHPVYGLQARGIGEPGAPLGTMEQMAADHADAITAAFPDGPYHLLGWSFGGLLAYATAAELTRRGHTVPMVALLDAYPSDPLLHTEEHRRVMLDVVLTDFGYDPAMLDGQPLADAHVAGLLKAAGGALADWNVERIEALIRVTGHQLRAARAYRPGPYDGDLLFFTATQSVPINLQTIDYWRPHVRGRIINHDIDARHEHMLRPHVVAEIGPVVAGYRRAGGLSAG
ncbi:non-ribosomal peptide synthetase [Actinoplanes derwentensis]|uniref:Enterobactin synthetase component F n=1 Tax=Actinoplanes derwentensis TaxID=113562 RepID=A0A1H1W8L9_9ACTN|nr:non-ribosomal peptide synthetase [Actinoplanes derwentensis]GID84089.1 hypothetical protein Ade03nite_30130 [Actinoplanes derwentensis]SDS93395.1 enterobactin synthetase component F [Actinoplanes derwentensis]